MLGAQGEQCSGLTCAIGLLGHEGSQQSGEPGRVIDGDARSPTERCNFVKCPHQLTQNERSPLELHLWIESERRGSPTSLPHA